jgi:hypothetical protein
MNASHSANLEHAGVGLSMWQRDEQGIRFRWAGGRSVIYVPADATAVRIPLRHGGQGPATIDVGIFIGGREANRIRLTAGAEWTVVRLLITRHDEARFLGVNLVAASPDSPQALSIVPGESSGVLMIGRVEPEGSRY